MFSTVRDCERNVKRCRGSKITQRWLVAVLLHCEERFKRIKGCTDITTVVAAIEAEQAGDPQRVRPAA